MLYLLQNKYTQTILIRLFNNKAPGDYYAETKDKKISRKTRKDYKDGKGKGKKIFLRPFADKQKQKTQTEAQAKNCADKNRIS
jgi:hypothetical protein